MAKYRKIYPRIWDSLEFRQLTPDEKLLCFNVLTGTQGNRVGCFVYRTAIAIEETGIESVGSLLDSLCSKMGWVYNKPTRIVWIPSWFGWNPPESRDALYGYISDLTELPKLQTVDSLYNSLCDSLLEYDRIKDSGAIGLKKFSVIWGELYLQVRQPVPQPVLHQELKQEQKQEQEQEHKPVAPKAQRTRYNAADESVPDWLESSWLDFCEHRVEKKRPITAKSAKTLIQQLLLWGEYRAPEAVRHSIANGYQGIFLPDTKSKGKSQLTLQEEMQGYSDIAARAMREMGHQPEEKEVTNE